MNKKIGIIIGVVVAVVAIVLGVVFLAPDKDVSVDDPTENITDVVNQDEVAEDVADEAEDAENTEMMIMRETIDLRSVDLTKYGLTKDVEISVPYPTSLGCVYVVRDYGKTDEQTYLFVTTNDDVMYLNTEFPSAGRIPIEDAHSLKTANLDGKDGEEVVLLANTGGSGGAGIFCNGIYKISNGKIVEMEISNEEPFEISLEAPYTVVFENKKFDYEEKIVCDNDSEALFDEKGNPDMSSLYYEERDSYDGGFYAPHETGIYTNDDGQPAVWFTSYSYLSRSVDEKTVESVVEYSYNSESNKFEITYVRLDVYVPEDIEEMYDSLDEYWDALAYTNGYTYYDINKDGVKEFITHTGTCEADRIYRVYCFADGKMYCAGEISGWHGTLCAKDKNIVVSCAGATEAGTFVETVTYELVNNELVKKETFEKEFIEEDELLAYYDEFEKTTKEIEVNNVYYR